MLNISMRQYFNLQFILEDVGITTVPTGVAGSCSPRIAAERPMVKPRPL